MEQTNRSECPGDVWDRVADWGVVPVVAVRDVEQGMLLGRALIDGGLPLIEVTLRTGAALEAIKALAGMEGLMVGAGTVHRPDQAREAVDAGAEFIVTPGFSDSVVRWCLDARVPVLPGTATPSDLERAIEFGLTHVKFFPAEPLGGVRMLKALAGPFAEMRFLPTGGIGPENLASYLELPSVFACGGSWMVKREWLERGALDRVRDAAAAARAQVRAIREAHRS